MADPLVSVAEVEDRLGYSPDSIQLQAFLVDASALVREIAGWSDDEPDTVPGGVVPVVVNMVRRAIENPHGHESERDGNYQYSGAKTDGIFATRDEAKKIRKSAGKLGVGSLQLEGYMPHGQHAHGSWLEDAL